MTNATPTDLTRLLIAWQNGNRRAGDKAFSRIYSTLRKLAAGQIKRRKHRKGHSTTSLVNEAYLRLTKQRVCLRSRGHLFGLFTEILSRVDADDYRSRRCCKRRGYEEPLSDNFLLAGERSSEERAVRSVLKDLRHHDPLMAEAINLRFFGGLTRKEICRDLGISTHQFRRLWERGRSFLRELLSATRGGM